MSKPRVHLTKESIVGVAHSVLQKIQCEWEGCNITLNCWNTLERHLARHCTLAAQQGSYYCSYSRCSGRTHNSVTALRTHVELSHLSRVALLCPARGCKEVFVRVQQFQSHFEHAHRDLMDKRVRDDVLEALAVLAPPRHLRSPPPFPKLQSGAWSLLYPISIPPVRRGNSQVSASQRLSRRWSRLNVQDEEVDDNPIPFDDFSSSQPRDIYQPGVVDVKVQRKPSLAKQSLLSCPRPPRLPFKTPEQAILYPAFVRMVDELVANGSLAAHKEGEA